jgi:hypothetical protein
LIPECTGTCYAVRSMFWITNSLNSVFFPYFLLCNKVWNNFWSVIRRTVKIYLFYRRQLLELWLMQNLDDLVEVYLRNYRFLPVPWQYTFSLVNFIVNNQEHFLKNSSVLSINIRNKHSFHSPNANLSCCRKSEFCAGFTFVCSFSLNHISVRKETTQFKVALNTYLNKHLFYSVHEFLVPKNDGREQF